MTKAKVKRNATLTEIRLAYCKPCGLMRPVIVLHPRCSRCNGLEFVEVKATTTGSGDVVFYATIPDDFMKDFSQGSQETKQ